MNRLALVTCLFLISISLLGCGMSDPPVPEDRSNMPPEVKAQEEKFDADNAKRVADMEKRKGKAGGR